MTGAVVGRQKRHLCILFHESAILGAGVSILRAAEYLRACGWMTSGWFPGPGPLVVESAAALGKLGYAPKPIAFSLRGWRQNPGVVQRLRRTPAYVSAFRQWLQQERPDIVHVNSLLMLPEATVARRMGFPVVVQVHEIPPAGRKRDLTLRWASALADALIGVSRPMTEMLAKHAGRTAVTLIHNGVPTFESQPPPETPFLVGTVGHVARTKGTDIFLRAAAIALESHPDLRFEHVGPTRPWGDDVFEDRIDAMAKSESLLPAVQMLGHRPAREAMTRWSIFVSPSRQEGFPLSTLEAMAAGIPLIATRVGGIPEQVTHLKHGILVDPEDPRAIADWIIRLHGDESLRSRLGAAGRSHVRDAFPLSAQADALRKTYEFALRARAASP